MGHIFIAGKEVKLCDPDFQSAVYVINFSNNKSMLYFKTVIVQLYFVCEIHKHVFFSWVEQKYCFQIDQKKFSFLCENYLLLLDYEIIYSIFHL